MKREFYCLDRQGLTRISQPLSRVFAAGVLSFFAGLAAGYAWRMAQIGGF